MHDPLFREEQIFAVRRHTHMELRRFAQCLYKAGGIDDRATVVAQSNGAGIVQRF